MTLSVSKPTTGLSMQYATSLTLSIWDYLKIREADKWSALKPTKKG